MNLPPDPASAPASTSSSVPWWWLLLGPDGEVIEPEDGRQEFPTRSDAESWVGEFYADLSDQGVKAVTLFEGDREVYGPMGLDPA